MKKNTKTITYQRAAEDLRVSDSTILRIVQRGTLHATRPELVKGHWTRRIIVDKAFLDERARRLNGLRSPRRKNSVPKPLSRQSANGAAADNPNREFNPADPAQSRPSHRNRNRS